MAEFPYPRGSEWRKWDLHAHTPLDSEWYNKPSSSTRAAKQAFAEEYVEFAKSEDLSVIAITDHNFCDDLDDCYIPFIEQAAAPAGITILPGFEITVADGQGVHCLVVFREHTDLSSILKTVEQLFPPSTQKVPSSGIVPVAQVNIEALQEVLARSSLDFVIAFAHIDRNNGVLRMPGGELRTRLWKKEFVQISQLSKPVQEVQQDSFIWNVCQGKDDNYRRAMSYVCASDCRSISRTGNDDGRTFLGEKFSWIKADPTFDGLRQVIYEPELRIWTGPSCPKAKPEHLVIDKVRFVDDRPEPDFSSDWLPVNSDLSVIIGGKSTGKSLLLHHVAKTISPEEVKLRSTDAGSTDYGHEGQDGFDFEVMWKDGTQDTLSASATAKTKAITFIPQMYIARLSEPEAMSKLSGIVLEILRQNSDYRRMYDEWREQLAAKRDAIQPILTQLRAHLDELQERMGELKEMPEQAVLTREVTELQSQMTVLREQSGFTDSEEKILLELNKESEELQSQANSCNTFEQALEDLQNTASESAKDFLDAVKHHAQELILRTHEDRRARLALKFFLQRILDDLDQAIDRTITTRFEERERLHQRAEKIAAQQTCLKEKLEPFATRVADKQRSTDLQKLLEEKKEQLIAVQNKLQIVEAVKRLVQTACATLVSKYEDLLRHYQSLQESTSGDGYSRVSESIRIRTDLSFDSEAFVSNFLEKFDRRKDLRQLFGSELDMSDGLVFHADTHVATIQKILEVLLTVPREQLCLRRRLRSTSGSETEQSTRHALVSALVQDWFRITFTPVQASEIITNMSPGKRASLILQLFLHLNDAKHPIIIDQPEENVDNRTIFTELNQFIRQKKQERQIIIVTHNANLAVSTDAEQVVVANQSGQELTRENREHRFEYVSAALENTSREDGDSEGVLYRKGIREHVCEILEGGQEAFMKREEKYGFRL